MTQEEKVRFVARQLEHVGDEVTYKLPRPKPIFTSEGNLRGGRSLWLIMITPTRWCGNGMSAHLATPRSHKFRIWKSLYYFSSY